MKKSIFASLLLIAAASAFAERADREKPISLEANRISVDDVKKVQIYEGNVVLSQGTLVIRSDKLVVTQDADGFQKGVAYGARIIGRFATLCQKCNGKMLVDVNLSYS